MTPLQLLRPLVSLGIVLYLVLSWHVADVLTTGDHHPVDHMPAELGLSYEDVVFRSRGDGVLLSGWLLRPDGDTRAVRPVVIVHGWRRDRQSELEGRVLEVAASLTRSGHTVLLFDLRGWGRSEGERFSLGANETRDVGGAIEYLAGRGLAPDGVNLLGYSMGASTVLLTAPEDGRVRAVVEDSGYAELAPLLDQLVPRYSGLPSAFTPAVVLFGGLLTGADLRGVRPIDGMSQLAHRGTPLLSVHGEQDDLVPVAQARKLAAAYGQQAETWIVPGAEHVGAFEVETNRYLQRLDDFFHRAAGAPQRR
jgi:pimeloyl-ACP methyl ester carboxylesterase